MSSTKRARTVARARGPSDRVARQARRDSISGVSLSTASSAFARNSLPAYPISRFYLKPLAAWCAYGLTATALRPVHVTWLGASLMLSAALIVAFALAPISVAAALVLLAWCCDRLDGELARRQGAASAWGAWLDANLDELGDLGIHTAIAAALAVRYDAVWPWPCLAAFLAGKYLFMYGLSVEPSTEGSSVSANQSAPAEATAGNSLVRQLYHLPANADVRLHLLVLALAWNFLAAELIWAAVYYNARWIVRYLLVARRLRGAA